MGKQIISISNDSHHHYPKLSMGVKSKLSFLPLLVVIVRLLQDAIQIVIVVFSFFFLAHSNFVMHWNLIVILIFH